MKSTQIAKPAREWFLWIADAEPPDHKKTRTEPGAYDGYLDQRRDDIKITVKWPSTK